jgi:hypothetical protein
MLKEHRKKLLDIIHDYEDQVPLDKLVWAIRDFDSTVTRCLFVGIEDSPVEFWARSLPDDFDRFEAQWTAFKPGFPLSGWVGEGREKSIDDIVKYFEYWLRDTAVRYVSEVYEPDPWGHLRQFQPLISDSTFTQEDLRSFTQQEKIEIRRSLQEFKRVVYENYTPDEAQQEFIEERLDYLSKSVDRLNRFDWRALAVSVVIGIGINLSVDTSTGATLLRLFERAFQSIRLFLP